MTLCGSCQLRSRLTCAGRRTAAPWLSEPDLNAWMGGSRLNLLRALPEYATEASVQTAIERHLTRLGTAIERISNWDRDALRY
jgi:hypothetical protein